MFLLDGLVSFKVLDTGVEVGELANIVNVDDTAVSDVAGANDNTDATAELGPAEVDERTWEVFSAAPDMV